MIRVAHGPCCRDNCLVWRRAVGAGDLSCLSNPRVYDSSGLGKTITRLSGIFEQKSYFILTNEQVVPALLTAFLWCFS